MTARWHVVFPALPRMRPDGVPIAQPTSTYPPAYDVGQEQDSAAPYQARNSASSTVYGSHGKGTSVKNKKNKNKKNKKITLFSAPPRRAGKRRDRVRGSSRKFAVVENVCRATYRWTVVQPPPRFAKAHFKKYRKVTRALLICVPVHSQNSGRVCACVRAFARARVCMYTLKIGIEQHNCIKFLQVLKNVFTRSPI